MFVVCFAECCLLQCSPNRTTNQTYNVVMRYVVNVSFLTRDGKHRSNVEHIVEAKNKAEAIEKTKNDRYRFDNADKSTLTVDYIAEK